MTDSDRSSRITTELVLKLFDTLRESDKDVKVTVDKQTDAIVHLSSLLKEGVTLEELKKILSEHDSSSGKHLDDIDTCTETIEDQGSQILKILKSISGKINTMILVVLISFALMTVSYVFVNNSVETMIKSKIEETVSDDCESDVLRKEIERLRNEIKGFHGE